VLEVALALAAALLFALGTVLQQKEAQRASGEEALRAGFLLQLARRPVWLGGIAADALGFVAQAAALGIGRIVVVQPILATTVVFALPLGARILGTRVGRREVGAALAVTTGLAVFLVVADPGGGREDATTAAWIASLAVAAAICVPLVLAGRAARRAPLKATLLGTATGVLFGVSAGLTKAVVEDLDEGIVALLSDWHLYALAVVGWASMTLAQASLQTGALAPAVATQSALDPIASVLLGVIAFEETIHGGALGLAGSLLGFLVMVGGIWVLATGAQESSDSNARSPAASARNRSAV
jgi:drug/metabolite transporter (DMT)-like permease